MQNETPSDVVLIGAGIMSATLGVMLKRLDPKLTIHIYERMDHAAAESSDAWNNAGTGHAAYCELNYTPQKEDGTIDISKAIKISESFEVSKQFWSFLVDCDLVDDPTTFIRSIPHMSFVIGQENVDFLEKRYSTMIKNPLFELMQYSKSHEQLEAWIPLVMKDRDPNQVNAATMMPLGTDVNFGALTRSMFNHLDDLDGVHIHFDHEVRQLHQDDDGLWDIEVKNLSTKDKFHVKSRFVFIGAGGGALPLLEKADIPEGDGFGGFPVSGQWLKCLNKDVIAQHYAKVYGKASVGAPPMSVPHIDSRLIDGEKALLFGPYAGFSTKFLKHGSYLDLPLSIGLDNIVPMLSAGFKNLPLTKYLIDQVTQSDEERLDALQRYVPSAKPEDWELEVAGQRVQVIKKNDAGGGELEFGTEVVAKSDGTLAALLGASPGASTAASIMIGLMEKCFPQKVKSAEWQKTLKEMIPSYGLSLSENPDLLAKVRQHSHLKLKIN